MVDHTSSISLFSYSLGSFMCVSFSNRRTSVTYRFVFAALLVVTGLNSSYLVSAENTNNSADQQRSALPPIVCLHTEYLPSKDPQMLRFRLMREIGRQAVLIAARDELGLLTRDETLDEVFPDSVKQAKHDVFVAVRSQFNGDVHIQVWTAAEPQQVEPIKKTNKYVVNSIQNQTTSAEKMIRGELREKLRNLGFEGKPLPRNEQNVPPHDIENHLLDMNYVSQFGAVRTAHAAIKQKGESRGWLGVLARGYANLALTTEHHWKSDTDVFAARALLYAQRLVSTSPDDLVAHANRAYVLALVGLHGAALEELERVKKLQTEHEQETLPGWLEVVKPYCTFERRSLVDLVRQRPTLSQLAQRLSFEQNRAFND